ncbi:DUF1798 family protein [Staphylococcus caprae]
MQHLIEQLIIEITEMNHRFERVKASEIDYDFYDVVQPYTESIDSKLDDLKNYDKQIINMPYMTPTKFNLLISNIQSLSVECHFKRTSRKLFTEKIKSVQYDLKNILTHHV